MMRPLRLPSWFKFLFVATAFEYIATADACLRLVVPLVPEPWWTLVGARVATLAVMALLAEQTLRSDGMRLKDVLASFGRWRSVAGRAALEGAFLAVLLVGLKAALNATGVVGPVSDRLMDLAREVERSPSTFAAVLLAFGVLAPLVEEFQYRAYAQMSMTRVWGDAPGRRWFYAALAALAFMLAHPVTHPAFYPGYFLAGLAFGWIYIRTRSFAACAVAHGSANLVQLALAYNLAG